MKKLLLFALALAAMFLYSCTSPFDSVEKNYTLEQLSGTWAYISTNEVSDAGHECFDVISGSQGLYYSAIDGVWTEESFSLSISNGDQLHTVYTNGKTKDYTIVHLDASTLIVRKHMGKSSTKDDIDYLAQRVRGDYKDKLIGTWDGIMSAFPTPPAGQPAILNSRIVFNEDNSYTQTILFEGDTEPTIEEGPFQLFGKYLVMIGESECRIAQLDFSSKVEGVSGPQLRLLIFKDDHQGPIFLPFYQNRGAEVDVSLLEGFWLVYSINGKPLEPNLMLFEHYERNDDGSFNYHVMYGDTIAPSSTLQLMQYERLLHQEGQNLVYYYEGEVGGSYRLTHLDETSYVMQDGNPADPTHIETALKIDPTAIGDKIAGTWHAPTQFPDNVTNTMVNDTISFTFTFDPMPDADPSDGQGQYVRTDYIGGHQGRFHLLGNWLVMIPDDTSVFPLYPTLAYEAALLHYESVNSLTMQMVIPYVEGSPLGPGSTEVIYHLTR